ncbi:MAG: hypothetical protein ACXWF6_08635 [Usitatibacter sp.]
MSAPIAITARLNDKCQPEFRGALFEDPLDAALRENALGEVDGGGTQLGPDGELAYCEVVILLSSNDEKSCDFVISKLNELGAPKGSKLILSQSAEIPFGVNEGMGIYLNGTDLSPEVYRTSDINVVMEELLKALDTAGQLHGYMEGARETALYFYGRSYDTMVSRTRSFVESYPLCQKARVSRIA